MQAFEFAFSVPTAEACEVIQPPALVEISNLWFKDFWIIVFISKQSTLMFFNISLIWVWSSGCSTCGRHPQWHYVSAKLLKSENRGVLSDLHECLNPAYNSIDFFHQVPLQCRSFSHLSVTDSTSTVTGSPSDKETRLMCWMEDWVLPGDHQVHSFQLNSDIPSAELNFK